MDTPSSFVPHEHPLVGVEECLDLLGHFSSPLPCFNWFVLCDCVTVRLQATKPVLFSIAYEGL